MAEDLTPTEVAAALKASPAIAANVEALWPLVVTALKANGIGSHLTQIGVAATIGVETPAFKPVEENLNYSANGLLATWEKRFPSLEFAQEYHRQPEKIANYVYADRNGNGPVTSGDGWRYRGRGPIQITGRANYRECGKSLGLELLVEPARLLELETGARSVAWFWAIHGLAHPCEMGQWVTVRRIVNGGLTHLADLLGIVRGFGVAA